MLINDNQYLSVIDNLKSEIQKSQYSAALAVNSELTMLYYRIGKVINEYKSWGNKFIDNLSRDLKIAFPNSTGYSVRNLKYGEICGRIPRCRICANGVCTNSLVAQRSDYGENKSSGNQRVVYSKNQ